MDYLNKAADFCAMPDTLRQATMRWAVLLPLIVVVVLLDKYLDTAAPAAMFGYALGSLTTYGSLRKTVTLGQAST